MADPNNTRTGFFTRWHQRREQVAAEEQALAEKAETSLREQSADAQRETETSTQQPADKQNVNQNVNQNENTDAQSAETPQDENRILTAEDLPNPNDIEIGGSFASFMGANVDPAAKSAALKALWKQPQFNEIDGLLEYALDYSNQPKLSPAVSAELAQKVFRFITEDKAEAEDTQEINTAASAHTEQNLTPLDCTAQETINTDGDTNTATELAKPVLADNLDEQTHALSQNAQNTPVKGQT